MIQKIRLILLVLIMVGCSDRSRELINYGKSAIADGRYEDAKAFLIQIDSTSAEWDQAQRLLRKIDSLRIQGFVEPTGPSGSAVFCSQRVAVPST